MKKWKYTQRFLCEMDEEGELDQAGLRPYPQVVCRYAAGLRSGQPDNTAGWWQSPGDDYSPDAGECSAGNNVTGRLFVRVQNSALAVKNIYKNDDESVC